MDTDPQGDCEADIRQRDQDEVRNECLPVVHVKQEHRSNNGGDACNTKCHSNLFHPIASCVNLYCCKVYTAPNNQRVLPSIA